MVSKTMKKLNMTTQTGFNYGGIPPGIQKRGRFCLYRLERKTPNAMKPDKVPYKQDGTRADPSNPADFCSFDEALAAYNSGGFDGIGIGCFDKVGMADLDGCVHDGKLDEWAQEIVDELDSYTELSPSGTGLHIFFLIKNFFYDKERYYINNRKTHLEVYVPGATHRFLTMTGQCIHGTEVMERTEQLKGVLEKYMVRPQADVTLPKVTAPGSFLSDSSVIAKMQTSKRGEKAKALWEGTIPDGKSHSEADMALAEILAFWCGGDIEQMDRLFRQSGLMRDKWDRPQSGSTYGWLTLEKAVRSCTAFYSPVLTPATDDFNDIVLKLTELDLVNNQRYRNNDIGNGRLFADVFKDIARFVPERKKWFIYDGKHWVSDIATLAVMELGKDLSDALLIYAATIRDEALRKLFLDNTKHWQQRRWRETYIKEAQSIYPVSMERFDSDIYLFNCDNVTIDLRGGTARSHAPDDFITKISPVSYDPEARYERFETFIDEVMSQDTDKARFLQKALGYGISGDTRYECMFFLYGETTRNGKGTLMESILRVLGDYGKAVRPETIAQKHNVNSQAPSEDIARLAGVRFANISEPSRGLVLNAAQVKSMTGSDTQNARFLNENSFDFEPQHKLYINTNYLPVITDMTVFSSNRVFVIPFDRHFEEWEQDRTLKQDFKKPEVQSAILNWLIAGYRMLRQEGFRKPKAVEDAINSYKHDSDKIAQFAEELLEADPNGEVRTGILYDTYRRWCEGNGCYYENARNFNQELRKFGTVVRKRPRTGGEKTTLLTGYRLKDHAEPLLA